MFKDMQEIEFLSLYDYLGHAAGSKLGKDVANAAAVEKIEYRTKTVTNPTYSGEIMMYPRPFLDKFFKGDVNDDLPF
jgi:hypothetical protein